MLWYSTKQKYSTYHRSGQHTQMPTWKPIHTTSHHFECILLAEAICEPAEYGEYGGCGWIIEKCERISAPSTAQAKSWWGTVDLMLVILFPHDICIVYTHCEHHRIEDEGFFRDRTCQEDSVRLTLFRATYSAFKQYNWLCKSCLKCKCKLSWELIHESWPNHVLMLWNSRCDPSGRWQ